MHGWDRRLLHTRMTNVAEHTETAAEVPPAQAKMSQRSHNAAPHSSFIHTHSQAQAHKLLLWLVDLESIGTYRTGETGGYPLTITSSIMTSPRPTSDDGSAYMAVDDEQSEAEEEEEEEKQLGGEGQEEGQEGEETDEASVPSQVLQEDEDSNGSSLAAARGSTSKQAEVLEQLDHLQDVRLRFVFVVRAVSGVLSFYLLHSSLSPPPRPTTHPFTPSLPLIPITPTQ